MWDLRVLLEDGRESQGPQDLPKMRTTFLSIGRIEDLTSPHISSLCSSSLRSLVHLNANAAVASDTEMLGLVAQAESGCLVQLLKVLRSPLLDVLLVSPPALSQPEADSLPQIMDIYPGRFIALEYCHSLCWQRRSSLEADDDLPKVTHGMPRFIFV